MLLFDSLASNRWLDTWMDEWIYRWLNEWVIERIKPGLPKLQFWPFRDIQMFLPFFSSLTYGPCFVPLIFHHPGSLVPVCFQMQNVALVLSGVWWVSVFSVRVSIHSHLAPSCAGESFFSTVVRPILVIMLLKVICGQDKAMGNNRSENSGIIVSWAQQSFLRIFSLFTFFFLK